MRWLRHVQREINKDIGKDIDEIKVKGTQRKGYAKKKGIKVIEKKWGHAE